jgi:hypothetical protein
LPGWLEKPDCHHRRMATRGQSRRRQSKKSRLYDPPKIERRLNILKLKVEIIGCTNKLVTLQCEMAKFEDRRADLQLQLATKIKDLAVIEAMFRSAGTATESTDTAGSDTR